MPWQPIPGFLVQRISIHGRRFRHRAAVYCSRSRLLNTAEPLLLIRGGNIFVAEAERLTVDFVVTVPAPGIEEINILADIPIE